MHELDMHARGAGEGDRFGDAVEDLVRFVAHMGEIGGVVAPQYGAEGQHLGGVGKAAGRREQARREAERGRRSSSPITISRSVLWPTSMPVLTATRGKVSRYSGKRISRNGSHGAPPLR